MDMQRAAKAAFAAILAAAVSASAKSNQPETREKQEPTPINAVVKIEVDTAKSNIFRPWISISDANTGSGAVIGHGRILTCAHCVTDASFIRVRKHNDDTPYKADVLFIDNDADLALVEVKDPKFMAGVAPLEIGDTPHVQDDVLAIGYPLGGYDISYTRGIVSRIEDIRYTHSWLFLLGVQVDAAINPGNSGGALVNIDGELIGINTMIYSQTGNYAGHSFAIPSAVVNKIVTDIKQYGSVQRAVLGIQFTELDADKAKEEKITATTEGIYVNKVNDLSSAKEAGIKEGDVIIGLNGATIKNGGQMLEEMSKLRPGDKATVKYIRDNKVKTTTVTFKNDQGTTNITKSSDFTSLGCAFLALNADEKEELGVSNGVKVTGLKDGKFKAAGITNGFVITDINNIRVNNQDEVEDIYNAIMRDKDSDKVMFITGIKTNGKKTYIAVDLADPE